MRKDVDEMSRHAGGLSRLRARRQRRASRSRPTWRWRWRNCAATPSATATPRPSSFHGLPVVTVKPASFKRCLANLVSNAARHANAIAITGHRDHRYLTVTVDDDGPGIPAGMREEVFKPFLRLDDARNQDEGGTGLGPRHRPRHRPLAWRRHHARRQPDGRLARDGADTGVTTVVHGELSAKRRRWLLPDFAHSRRATELTSAAASAACPSAFPCP